MCLIRLFRRNCENSDDVNCGPLSETSCSGRPCGANIVLRTSIVFSDVVDDITATSGHFEYASTTTRKV